jgi:hypothetical protein
MADVNAYLDTITPSTPQEDMDAWRAQVMQKHGIDDAQLDELITNHMKAGGRAVGAPQEYKPNPSSVEKIPDDVDKSMMKDPLGDELREAARVEECDDPLGKVLKSL